MLNNSQVRELIIQPALDKIAAYSEEAEELLVATLAHESLGGTYLSQIKGPALGIYQMEAATYDQLWQGFITTRPVLMRNLLTGCGYVVRPDASVMVHNLWYATMMARIYYLRVPDKLPAADDLQAIYQYYKSYWNTALGKADEGSFMKHYQQFTSPRKGK